MVIADAELEPTSNKYKWSTGTIIEDSDPIWTPTFPSRAHHKGKRGLVGKVSTEEYS